MGRKRAPVRDPATEAFQEALWAIRSHPMFAALAGRADIRRNEWNGCPDEAWAVVAEDGRIDVHPKRRASPDEWVYVLAHALLHLGFGHFEAPRERWREWNAACDVFVAAFLADLKLGRAPFGVLPDLPAGTEERLYARFVRDGVPPALLGLGTGGPHPDMLPRTGVVDRWDGPTDWRALFGRGLSLAVTQAVDVAAGRLDRLGARTDRSTEAWRAREWFVASYPLLGALAAAFDLVEDGLVCQRLGISVAAVDPVSREIFINPAAGMDEDECRFVMAHELLHVGLRHLERREGRDPFLWNVACDYVVNGWLVEMRVGALPRLGVLYDPELKGESAEAVYDRIVTDVRRFRKLATLRGVGLGDMLERGHPGRRRADGMDLDEFFRRCLGQGLAFHEANGRGFLPAGLVEEIRALGHPPIPWDVELARWFDDHFAPLETVRSYARPSRRQSSTPEIPRPRWVAAPGAEDGRTFGVVLDTSGSMDRALLAKALGAIASYAVARDVPAARVVFCDAAAYDQGYMAPDAIAERVQVRGRGGTVLQPAVDLLERAEDFPRDAPVLVITDGQCDRLRIFRPHAFLMPKGARLPFVARGEVFRVE